MKPKVTIILPVYNVEPYLRQCLDSVVNQTLRDIQIICVNDGSTDASPAILEEYAAKDSRIEVYHQENQGGGSARNAAYPYIRGKYTYFADPDDWLELELCQQCWDIAKTTESDCVFFGATYHNSTSRHLFHIDPSSPKIRQSVEEKSVLLLSAAPWYRFWRSEFLLSNQVKFAEGKRPFNDQLHAWKGTVLANYIVILDRPLYHYRVRQGSYQSTINELHFSVIETKCEIEKMLHETDSYEVYKGIFFRKKLLLYYRVFRRLPRSLRAKFLQRIRRHENETGNKLREYCLNASPKQFPNKLRKFYLLLVVGGWLGAVRYYFSNAIKMPERLLRHCIIKPLKNVNRIIMRPLENLVRVLCGKPIKTVRKVQLSDIDRQTRDLKKLVRKLSMEIAELRHEVLELRGQLQNQVQNETPVKRAA